MRCSACGHDSAGPARFCAECGGGLGSDQPGNDAESAVGKSETEFTSGQPGRSHHGESAGDDLKAGATRAPWLDDAKVGSVSPLPPGSVRIIQELERYRGSNTTATLAFPQRSQFVRVHLLGTDKLNFGRVPERNDVTLIVLPLTPENHALSQAISSQHFQILLEPGGLLLKDESKYGTSLNGQKVQRSAKIPLDQVSEVAVAVSLRLRLTPLVSQSPGGGRSEDPYVSIGPADALWKTASGLGIDALFIERVDNVAEQEGYLMVFTWAALGPVLDGMDGLPAVEGGRLRLVRRQGQFWLHNVAAIASPTVAGVPVPVGHVGPLVPGLTIGLGKETAQWTSMQQYGIEGM